MSVQSSANDYKITIDFVGKHFDIDSFDVDLEDSVLAKWELGGLTDPIGQISNWFYNKIAPALNSLGSSISNYVNQLVSPIHNIVTNVENIVNQILNDILSLPGKIVSGVQSLIAGIQSNLGSIVTAVESLGKSVASIPSYVVSAIQGAITGIQSTIESLSGSVESIISIVESIPSEIVTQIQGIITSISATIESLPEQIQSLIQPIEEAVTSLPSEIYNTIQGIITSISTTIEQLPEQIHDMIMGIASTIEQLPDQIQNIIQNSFKFFESLPDELHKLFSPIYQLIEKLPDNIFKLVQKALGGITTYIHKISKSLHLNIGNIEKAIVNLPKEIKQYVIGSIHGFITTIKKILDKIHTTIGTTYTKLKTQFGGSIANILHGLNEVKTVLAGFINPLVDIKHIFSQLYTDISDWITKTKDKFVSYLEAVPKKIKSIAKDFSTLVSDIENLPSKLKDIFNEIKHKFSGEWTIAESFASDAIQMIKKEAGNVIKFAESAIETFVKDVTTIATTVFNAAKSSIAAVESSVAWIVSELTSSAKNAISSVLNTIASSLFGDEYTKNMSDVVTEIYEGLAGFAALEIFGALINETVISLEVLGLGGQIRSKLGKAIEKIPESFKKTLADILRDIAFAFTFWVIEPVKYQYYRIARNVYPVEIPTLGELIEITRRQIPTEQFSEYYQKMITSLQYRGYQDWAINAWSNLVSNGAYVTIKDRFGHERKFPTSVLYEIPTVSDLCRMMVKDLFWPEDPLPHFEKAMELHGVIPDIAKMYYMLHFRYPAMDVLFKFICRAAAGFAWVTEKPQTYQDLGYEGVAPAGLNNTNWKNATQTLQKYLKFIIPYSKWHDYSPFAWVKGFTADRLIVVDMMAKLPDKIDARWMFKWNVIDDTTFYRLIVSQGYHPNFVEDITVAEILNVIGESRTYVRSGIIEMFRNGIMTIEDLKNKLANITSFNVLGQDITVRYLEPEIDMITQRAKYDRAYEFMRSATHTLSRLYYENVIDEGTLTDSFTSIAESISKSFDVTISVDDSYLDVLKNVLKFEYQLYTIGRVRIWIRYLLYRLMERFSEGYVKKSEIDDFIQILANEGKLTEPEIELLKESAFLMYDFFVRKTKAEAILRRLARGVITIDQAKKELLKLGLDESVVDAMIEEHVKIYTFSVEHLIEMSEYVPVDTKYIEEKAKLYGMPPQEIKMLPAYKIAKDIASYVRRLITELIDDYEYGVIDLKTLEKKIDEVRTLNGQVKKLGVSWIVIDDLEKKLIIEIAKLRRERHERMTEEREERYRYRR